MLTEKQNLILTLRWADNCIGRILWLVENRKRIGDQDYVFIDDCRDKIESCLLEILKDDYEIKKEIENEIR